MKATKDKIKEGALELTTGKDEISFEIFFWWVCSLTTYKFDVELGKEYVKILM